MDETLSEVYDYPAPVNELLTYGDPRKWVTWPDYLSMGLGPEHVPALIRMATDETLNMADSESTEVWAPLHAWRALGQLGAIEAAEPLARMLERLDEPDYDDDWMMTELPEVFASIGPGALPALASLLTDTSKGTWSRAVASEGIEEIVKRTPEAREEAAAALSTALERYQDNDPWVNASIIHSLVEIQAVEAAPLIEQAFAADVVDLSLRGDWEDAQVDLGLKAKRETPRKPINLFGWGQDASLPFLEPDTAPSSPDPKRKAGQKAKSKRKQAKQSRKKNRKRK